MFTINFPPRKIVMTFGIARFVSPPTISRRNDYSKRVALLWVSLESSPRENWYSIPSNDGLDCLAWFMYVAFKMRIEIATASAGVSSRR